MTVFSVFSVEEVTVSCLGWRLSLVTAVFSATSEGCSTVLLPRWNTASNTMLAAMPAMSHLRATIFGFSLTVFGSILIFALSSLMGCSGVPSSISMSTSPLSNSVNISLYAAHSSSTSWVRKYCASTSSSATLVSPAINLPSS